MPLSFRSLPGKTKMLLGVGAILALTLALPLFIWGIITQRFDIRKRAQIAVPPPGTLCNGSEEGGPCQITDCPQCEGELCPLRPCTLQEGTCRQGVCIPATTPAPTPVADCTGQPDGVLCQAVSCPAKGLRPCVILPGLCANGTCGSSCPAGNKGNIDCDSKSLIDETDLSILLAAWVNNPNGCGSASIVVPPGKFSPDLNGDCSVNETDLSILLSNWKSS